MNVNLPLLIYFVFTSQYNNIEIYLVCNNIYSYFVSCEIY